MALTHHALVQPIDLTEPCAPGRAGERHVLVVGTEDWAVGSAADRLAGAGWQAHRCSDSVEAPLPCRALTGEGCPLDAQAVSVVLDVRPRPRHGLAPSEMGVACAARSSIPVVAAGITHADGASRWAAAVVPMGGDLVATCEAVAADRPAEMTR